MKLVLVESPFAGDVETNLRYLRACLRDCLLRGEAPFASHALYTQAGVLDDLVIEERRLGIEAGLCWGAKADATVVYTDRGVSTGMRLGLRDAEVARRPIEYRRLGGEWSKGTDGLPTEAPSSGELVAGVDGSRLDEGPARAQEQDRQAGAVRLADSAGPGAWATDAPAAVKPSTPAGERSAGR